MAEVGADEDSYTIPFAVNEPEKQLRVIAVNEAGEESRPSATVTIVPVTVDDADREIVTEQVVTKRTKTTKTTTTTKHVEAEVDEEVMEEPVGKAPETKSPKKDRAVKSKPETPQNVEVVSEDQETLTVQWSAPAEPVVKYIVEEKTAEKRTWHKVAEVEPEETSYAVPFRAGETEKQVRVISVNEAGESPPSAPVTVVEDAEYPEKPKEKVVKKVTKTKTTTTTTVETESNIGEEELEAVPAKRGESVTPKKDQAKTSKPESPRNVAVTVSEDEAIATVQWTQPEVKESAAPVTKFIIEEKTETQKQWHKVAEVGPGEESCTVPLEETEKQVRVTAVNEAGPGQPSASVTVVATGDIESKKAKKVVKKQTTTTTTTDEEKEEVTDKKKPAQKEETPGNPSCLCCFRPPSCRFFCPALAVQNVSMHRSHRVHLLQ